MKLPPFLRGREVPAGTDPGGAAVAAALAARMRSWDVRRLPVVVGLRMLVADVAASLPMVAVRGNARVDPQPMVLRRPDPDEPYRTTMERTVNSLTGWGNAFFQVWKTGTDSWPLAVKLMQPADVLVGLDTWQERVVAYDYHGRHLPTSNVLHVPFITDPGPLGDSPLERIQTVVDDLATAYDWAATYWRDGGTPPYALTNPTKIADSQADAMLDRWLAARRRHRPAMLTGPWKLETFNAPTAADALLVDGLNYLDAAIARAFNVPPSLANVVSQQSLTYATTTDEMRRWLALNLYPSYLARIEAGFTDLLPRGQVAVFDTSNLLRTDWVSRVNAAAAAVAAGLADADEMRVSQLGLPPRNTTAMVPTSPVVEGV